MKTAKVLLLENFPLYGSLNVPPIIMQKPTLDPSHSVKSLSNGQREQSDLSGTIEFKGVHFSYPSRPDFKVMHISIHANGATLLCTHSDLHTDRYSGNG